MKWVNKGKELDEKAKYIVDEFAEIKGIYIFGAGVLGGELRTVLETYDIFAGYIDNSHEKQKNGHEGIKVLSLSDYKNMREKTWIVVAASKHHSADICAQLSAEAMLEGSNFFLLENFMNEIFPIISLYYYNKLYVDLAQICLTERCTLRCKKCAHACFNVSGKRKDPSVSFVKESADIFFSKFDIVREFVLIGGEPFLYKEIKDVITYIGENYRKQIIMFSITTNGTILPDDEIIELCLKYDITFRVSDYSESLPKLKLQYDRLYQKLSHNKVIVWKTDNKNSWFDYGFTEVDRGNKEEDLICAFDKCRTPCREISGSKYYYCVMARSVAENLDMKIGGNDYLDLSEVEDRKILLEFQMGYSDKGYLDMCRFCRGADAENYLIPAAEQMEIRTER